MITKTTLIPGSRRAIKKLQASGHTITPLVLSSLSSKKVADLGLRKHGFPFHHIEIRKSSAYVYIDDRIEKHTWPKLIRGLAWLSKME